jgi:membrane-associated phospholipid phosphatase
MNYVELIDRLDKMVFIIIQHDSDSKYFDHIMPVLRNPLTWIPLYCFLFYYIVTRFREMIIPFILLTIATVCVNDMLSSWVIKPWVERPRPCYDEDIKPFLRAVIECGGRFSFPSSHAANHVGLATFWYLTIKQVTGRKWYWLFVWALLIGYAQIYVGKHYPLDIAAGSLMGILTGYIFAALFRQWPLLTKSFVSLRKADSL